MARRKPVFADFYTTRRAQRTLANLADLIYSIWEDSGWTMERRALAANEHWKGTGRPLGLYGLARLVR